MNGKPSGRCPSLADSIDELLEIMRALRDPVHGCPWDIEQDFRTIAPYTLEEAYEVVDAIEREAPEELCGELGDLLFQVVFHAQMASESGWFGFADVVAAINEKMICRHPHVFADDKVRDAKHQTEVWEQHKHRERAAQGKEHASAIDGVPPALPALVRAQKIQRKAARVGFDWRETADVLPRLHEELAEIEQALNEEEPLQRVQEELGDLLFACVNLSRFIEADAETLLRDATRRFETRFHCVEEKAAQGGRPMQAYTLEELEVFWQLAKAETGV